MNAVIDHDGLASVVARAADGDEVAFARLVAAHHDDMARVALQHLTTGSAQSQAELTSRERQVIVGIASGRSNKEIASDLNISTRTVESHRESLMRKLDIHGVGGLTKYAVATGLVTLREGTVR